MKTEKQKAAEGLLYDANNDPDLQREMLKPAAACTGTTYCRLKNCSRGTS